MVKSTKNSRIWFSLLKVLLLFGVMYLLFFQLDKAQFDSGKIRVESYWVLFCAILLVPLNWWLEYRKWQLTIKVSGAETNEQWTRQSFFAGMISGMLTPNMLGNFIGRMFYFQRRYRVSITLLTLLSNYAQFAASMLFGFIAIISLQLTPLGAPSSTMIFLFLFLLILVVLGLFYFDLIFKWLFPSRMRMYFRLKSLGDRINYRWSIAAYSIVRHLIFTLQLGLTLKAFGANIGTFEILWIWQYYFWVTLTPSLFLGKFIIRDSVALWVLAMTFMKAETIILASLSIWIMNLLLPTFVALLFVRSKN